MGDIDSFQVRRNDVFFGTPMFDSRARAGRAIRSFADTPTSAFTITGARGYFDGLGGPFTPVQSFTCVSYVFPTNDVVPGDGWNWGLNAGFRGTYRGSFPWRMKFISAGPIAVTDVWSSHGWTEASTIYYHMTQSTVLSTPYVSWANSFFVGGTEDLALAGVVFFNALTTPRIFVEALFDSILSPITSIVSPAYERVLLDYRLPFE